MKRYYVYILTNAHHTVLYIGRTENLSNRVTGHTAKSVKSFTGKYNVDKLIYYEIYEDKEAAAEREYSLKRWRRKWKEELVSSVNPEWKDLAHELVYI